MRNGRIQAHVAIAAVSQKRRYSVGFGGCKGESQARRVCCIRQDLFLLLRGRDTQAIHVERKVSSRSSLRGNEWEGMMCEKA
jgi:hypothetical protein